VAGEQLGDLLGETVRGPAPQPDGDDDVALPTAQPDHPRQLGWSAT
jgi:hypothetical protein